ncbi:probable imidazolonepropionase isoform X3 [Phyllopteryx taeniolatus]|uniref:probable imidazolonepropionase isoform X3 n=1 Tax=Phyllopteryx taeniolatus TaxID=161469 RepID=UPI002AD2C9EB|nr:probable imidazolonepropionase isoform X3 [Phyllopteryx taeniolatus]
MSYGPAGFATFFGSFAPASDGLIEAAGPADVMERRYSQASFDRVIDAAGMCVLPGECRPSALTGTLIDDDDDDDDADGRLGGRAHSPHLGRRPRARVRDEAGGRHLHGRAPRGRRHPLHGGAHAGRLGARAPGVAERAAGARAAGRHHPGGGQERLRPGAGGRAEDAGGGGGSPPHSAHQHLLHLLRRPRRAQREERGRSHPRHPAGSTSGAEGAHGGRDAAGGQHRRLLRGGRLRRAVHARHPAGGQGHGPQRQLSRGRAQSHERRRAGGRAGGAGRQPPGGSVGPGHRRHGAGRDGGRPAAYHGLRSPAPPTAGASHAGRGRHRGAGQRLQPQRVLLLHAHRHAPGVRQHEDVHARGLGGGHHQRRLRPRTLAHARLTGGGQTRRPAAHRRPAVGAPHLSAGRTSGAHPLRRRQGRRRLRQPPHAALVKSSCKRRPEFLADSSHLDGLDSS